MSFGLGFLVASLAALLILPTLNRRATRLARRRLDGLFPMSMQEIAAERDALRAQFAVSERRMERKVEAARADRHAGMAELGARTLEIAALAREVEGREALLAQRRAEIEEALARIAGLDRELSTARTEGAAGQTALTALEDAHREILVDLKTVRRERDSVRHDLQGLLAQAQPAGTTPAEGAPQDERQDGTALAAEAAPVADPDDLRTRYDAVASERDVLRASLRAAEDALARVLAERGTARGSDDGRGDAELRSRITEVADALTRRDRLPAVGTFPLPAAARS